MIASEPPLAGSPSFTLAVSNALGGAQAVLVVDRSDPGAGPSVPSTGAFARVGVQLSGGGAGQGADSASLTRAEFDPAFVLMEYFGYLRRDPDEAGYQFWLSKLEQFNGNYIQAEMVKAFINSDEYRRRFGQ
jgi:hypothetical protein